MWRALGPKFVRGQLCLLCAAPGAGKSAFALAYAIKAKVPTLYFSADSSSDIQLSRAMSVVSGCRLDDSVESVRARDIGKAEAALQSMPIRFAYDPNPSLKDIAAHTSAYNEVFGESPWLIIVDNISDVQRPADTENAYSDMEFVLGALHNMARDTSACVIGMHHVTGGFNDSNQPIPLSGVKGQISRVPETILTIHRTNSDRDYMRVSTVKNRYGKSDPSGYGYAELEFDGASMQIRDLTQNRQG